MFAAKDEFKKYREEKGKVFIGFFTITALSSSSSAAYAH
jgi:hypothetical protein